VVVEECTVEVDNVFRVTAVHNLELSHDSPPNLLLCLDMDDLRTVRTIRTPGGESDQCMHTLRAMVVPVVICLTLLTVPPLPEPSSLMNSRSSGRKSSLYSIPISSCSFLLGSSLPGPPYPPVS